MFLRLYTTIKSIITTSLVLTTSTLLCANDKPSHYGDIADYGEKYLSPDFIKHHNNNIFITARTGEELLILKDYKVNKVVKLSKYPSGLAISNDGNFAYVTLANPKGELVKIETKSGKIESKTPVGHMPRAVELSPDNKYLYVANQFKNTVTKYDTQTLKPLKTGTVIRDSFSIAPTPNGKKILVMNQLPESKGGLYEENIAACVSILDADSMENIANIQLPNGSINAKEIISDKEGKYAYCTHVVARFNVPTSQVERGWINTNAISIIDIENAKLYATVLLDDIEMGAANPYGIVITDDDKFLVVAIAGTHELTIIQKPEMLDRLADKFAKSKNQLETLDAICNDIAFLGGIKKRLLLDGYAPRHLTTVGNTAYVGMYYSDTINKVDLVDYKVSKISIGGNEVLNEIRLGDLYYHDAALCFQKWLSCVTCHTEVRSDALNWDLLNDGIGNPKQSKSMLYSHVTPPSMITGIRKDATIAVRKGIQHIQFTTRPEKDAVAIDKYLTSLQAVDSPYLVDGDISDAAMNGEILFEMAKCAQCHSGDYYSDGKYHDVDSGLNEYEGFPFNTPTLREVWRTAPYLYDGRAKTIFDMLKDFNKSDKHGITTNLSDEELRELEEYVLTL